MVVHVARGAVRKKESSLHKRVNLTYDRIE